MTLKRIFPIALGIAMIAFSNVQGYAFMAAPSDVPAPTGQIDLIETVAQLKAVMKNDELSCQVKMSKLDAALDSIDDALDAGVEDESKYLAARDAIVEMRLELPCLGEQLVQEGSAGEVISDQIIGESIVDGGSVLDGGLIPGGSTMVGGSCSSCSSTHSGGGGGGGHHGGGHRGLALLAGAGAAIAIPLATSDDSDPGVPASPSN